MSSSVVLSSSAASPVRRAVASVGRFFAPRHLPGTIRPNLISAAISTVTVLVSCLVFTPQLGIISLLGALTPFWETGRPLWARVRVGLFVSFALTGLMGVGVLIAPHHWAVVPASVAIILVVGVLYQAFMLTRGPSPVMLFYAAVIGTFFGSDPTTGWSMVGVTAFASVLTTLLLLVPLAFTPHGPERRAVAGARAAVTTYQEQARVDETPTETLRRSRNAAHQAVHAGWLTVRSARPATGGRVNRELTRELLELESRLASTVLGDPAPGPTVRAESPATVRAGRPGWRFLLGHALRGGSVEWFVTWRMALAAAVAGLVSEAVGIGHPYWAIVTSTIIINQWMDRVTATRRAGHRTVGTLIGVGVVWAVSATHPSPWAATAVVVVCMIGQYLTFPLNYGLALVFITPMALLSVLAGGNSGSVATLAGDRFTDTVIGALTAVAVTWATSWFFPRRLVRRQSARSVAALEAVELLNRSGDPFSPAGWRTRVELQHELVQHLSTLERAVADDPRLADLAPAEHAIADRSCTALALSWFPRSSTAPQSI